MKKNKVVDFFCMLSVFLCVFFLGSCACVPTQDKLILTGFVLDEKSTPVSEMDIRINTGSGGIVNVRTNEDGFFQVYNVKKGIFSFSGKKEGYTELEEKMKVSDFSKVMCFRLSSADYVFEQVQMMTSKGEYKESVILLDSLYPGKEKILGKCISFYKKNINQKRHEK